MTQIQSVSLFVKSPQTRLISILSVYAAILPVRNLRSWHNSGAGEVGWAGFQPQRPRKFVYCLFYSLYFFLFPRLPSHLSYLMGRSPSLTAQASGFNPGLKDNSAEVLASLRSLDWIQAGGGGFPVHPLVFKAP